MTGWIIRSIVIRLILDSISLGLKIVLHVENFDLSHSVLNYNARVKSSEDNNGKYLVRT